jgi:hypothetical protein
VMARDRKDKTLPLINADCADDRGSGKSQICTAETQRRGENLTTD